MRVSNSTQNVSLEIHRRQCITDERGLFTYFTLWTSTSIDAVLVAMLGCPNVIRF